jgi:hypothetical protein
VASGDYCGAAPPADTFWVSDPTPCANAPVVVQASGEAEYAWTFSPSGTPETATGPTAVVRFAQPGPATIQLVLRQGFCTDTLSAALVVTPGPAPFSLGSDTLLCNPKPGKAIDLAYLSADAYVWSDGFEGPQRVLETTGTYAVTVETGACALSDTIALDVRTPVDLGLPSDTLLCGFDSVYLDVGAVDAERYVWSDGVQTPGRYVREEGYYGVTASMGPCPSSDFIAVQLLPPPPPLPSDTVVCRDSLLVLDVGNSVQGAIAWNGAPGFAQYTVENEGWVTRTVRYRQCVFEDAVYVRRIDCADAFLYYAPNVFSPDGDGENDRFELFGFDLEVLRIDVYDRWGALVAFDASAPAAFWDGQGAAPGVYVWAAQVRQRGREGVVAGSVLVVR